MNMANLTEAQIKAATGSTLANAKKFAPYIQNVCDKYQINTPVRQLCFLAQVGHESGGLFFTEELASGAAYEGRKNLGNTQPGDGIKFKGRGLIQITGRNNYESMGLAFGADLVNNPSLLGAKDISKCTPEQLKNAALGAGWFWDTRKINAIADKINIKLPINTGKNLEAFIAVTKKINGGKNGLDDRIARYKSGLLFFK